MPGMCVEDAPAQTEGAIMSLKLSGMMISSSVIGVIGVSVKDLGRPATICLTVHPDAHWVRIEVEDLGHRRPVLRAATLDAVDGRGLLVVDKLATDWGTEQRATHKV